MFWIAMTEHSNKSLASFRAHDHLPYLMQKIERVVRDGHSVEETTYVLGDCRQRQARSGQLSQEASELNTSAKIRESAPLDIGTL